MNNLADDAYQGGFSTKAASVNEKFLAGIKSGSAGIEKLAKWVNSKIVLTILNEDGLFRRMFNILPATSQDLDLDFANPDTPTMYNAVQNPIKTFLVHSSDFLSGTEDLWYKSKYFKIQFVPMVSRKVKMTEEQIYAAKYPIRQLIESQIHNDFLALEDFQMLDRFERCIQKTGMHSLAPSTSGLFKKEHMMYIAKMFPPQKLSAFQVVMNETTFYDIFSWNTGEVGDIVMADIVDKGVAQENLKFKSYFGFKFLLTNNTDIVPERALYATVPQRFLGNAYSLQNLETYVKFEDGILSMYSKQIIGRAIANAYGVGKISLQ